MYKILNKNTDFYHCFRCKTQVGLHNDICPKCKETFQGTYNVELPKDLIKKMNLNYFVQSVLKNKMKMRFFVKTAVLKYHRKN